MPIFFGFTCGCCIMKVMILRPEICRGKSQSFRGLGTASMVLSVALKQPSGP